MVLPFMIATNFLGACAGCAVDATDMVDEISSTTADLTLEGGVTVEPEAHEAAAPETTLASHSSCAAGVRQARVDFGKVQHV